MEELEEGMSGWASVRWPMNGEAVSGQLDCRHARQHAPAEANQTRPHGEWDGATLRSGRSKRCGVGVKCLP